MKIADNLKREMDAMGISVYRAAKLTGIKYELLRRSLHGGRKLSAEEFVLIAEKCGIELEKVKE